MADNKWQCGTCDRVMSFDDIINFPDPEKRGNTWAICPNCRTAEDFLELCDQPECMREATCGTPTKDGYRRTCYQHRPESMNG